MSVRRQAVGRAGAGTQPFEPDPVALRSGRPVSRPTIDGEIVDVFQAIRRIERPIDDIPASAAAMADETPPRPPYDPAAPLALSVWSERETHRLLATLIRQRVANDRAAGASLSNAAHMSDTVSAAIAQWLGENDKVVTSATARAWQPAFFDTDAPRAAVPPVVEAGPSAAIEAAMAARMLTAPDVVVAIAGYADKLPFGLSDAVALAALHELPVLFVGTRETTETGDALPRISASAVGRLMTENGFEMAHIDGDDVIAASEAAGELIHTVRCGRGPAYLQATCASESIGRDPLGRLREAMVARGDIDAVSAEAIADDIRRRAGRIGR